MVWSLISKLPAAGPVLMILLNICLFFGELCATGRFKPNCFRFTFLYLGTIPAALRGDLTPFLVVFTMPA